LRWQSSGRRSNGRAGARPDAGDPSSRELALSRLRGNTGSSSARKRFDLTVSPGDEAGQRDEEEHTAQRERRCWAEIERDGSDSRDRSGHDRVDDSDDAWNRHEPWAGEGHFRMATADWRIPMSSSYLLVTKIDVRPIVSV